MHNPCAELPSASYGEAEKAFSDIFEHYLKRLTEEAQQGDAREESFYPASRGQADMRMYTSPYRLYAQTVTYRATDGFTRRAAFDHIPRTIGFISPEDLPAGMAWIVDDIAEVLAVADVNGMLERYYRIVHFYETFLAHYDPDERPGGAVHCALPARAVEGEIRAERWTGVARSDPARPGGRHDDLRGARGRDRHPRIHTQIRRDPAPLLRLRADDGALRSRSPEDGFLPRGDGLPSGA